MADNVTLPATSSVVATDDIGGVNYQRVKVVWGADGVANDASAANPVPTTALTDTQLRASAVPVSAASLPLPSGAATQTTLASIDTDVGALADAAATTDTGSFSIISFIKRGMQNWTTLLARIPAQGQATMAASQPVAIASNQSAVPVSGTFWQATQPVSAASLPLPTGAATETTLAALNTKMPAQGQAVMASSQPVVIASNQSAIPVAPPAALLTSYNQAGVIAINTVLMTLDCSQWRSISIQCISMGTTGVVTPEWSNDNTTWVTATILTQAGATATTFNAAGLWVVPVHARYMRLRLSTATTAGTTTLSVHQLDENFSNWLATQPVSGTVTANIGTGSIAAGTNAIGDVGVQYRANATGAASFVSAQSPATPAVGTIKASAGRLIGWQLQNSSTGIRSVKIFNATAPTLGTTAASFEIDLAAGQRSDVQLPGGIGFATAITWSATSAKGLTDNTATGLALNDVSGAFYFA